MHIGVGLSIPTIRFLFAGTTAVLPTQDNTVAGDTTNLSGNQAWKSRFQALEARFTALAAS